MGIGWAYEYAGEVEKAIDWFEQGYQITGPNVPCLGASVKSTAVQSNPRFIKLLRDIKLDIGLTGIHNPVSEAYVRFEVLLLIPEGHDAET